MPFLPAKALSPVPLTARYEEDKCEAQETMSVRPEKSRRTACTRLTRSTKPSHFRFFDHQEKRRDFHCARCPLPRPDGGSSRSRKRSTVKRSTATKIEYDPCRPRLARGVLVHRRVLHHRPSPSPRCKPERRSGKKSLCRSWPNNNPFIAGRQGL